MWRVRRRLQRLESELAEARDGQADLQRRLERFEMIAAAAGAEVSPAAPGAAIAGPSKAGPGAPSGPTPPSLLAAARELHRREVPVRLDVGGTEVIAVVSGEGDPREWWAAIWQLASPAGETS